MGGDSSAPCFAEARSDARGAVLQGLYDGLGCPKCAQRMRQTVKSWSHGQNGRLAAPRFLEGLLEAMLQSFYDRFGGLSKLTEGRMRTRTAMLEISWLPRSLEGADASFWPANVCLFIFPGLRVSFCFWVRGLTCFLFG